MPCMGTPGGPPAPGGKPAAVKIQFVKLCAKNVETRHERKSVCIEIFVKMPEKHICYSSSELSYQMGARMIVQGIHNLGPLFGLQPGAMLSAASLLQEDNPEAIALARGSMDCTKT